MSRQWLEKTERIGIDVTSGYMVWEMGAEQEESGLGSCLGYLGRWWYPSLR